MSSQDNADSKDMYLQVLESTTDSEEDDNCFEVEQNPLLNEEYPNSSKLKETATQSMESKRYSVSDNTNLDALLRPKLPNINCPEKIIICLDLSVEMNEVPFRLGTGTEFLPLYMIKRVVEIFVIGKNRFDKNHEFALMLLFESGYWVHDFTKNIKEFLFRLNKLEDLQHCEEADLSSCFDAISEKVTFPVVDDVTITPPPYVVRTIFIYGRSQCIPSFKLRSESFRRLITSNYYFVDILYVHVVPSKDNRCEEIFEKLCELDTFGDSYIFEVTRNPTKLHDCMAKLLAHPLQRALQKDLGGGLESI